MKLTFVFSLVALVSTATATITNTVAKPQQTRDVVYAEYSDSYFDELVDETRSWLSEQMHRALNDKYISTEDFTDNQKRHKFESMILQGYLALPVQKGEKYPPIDKEGIVANLKEMAAGEAAAIPTTLSRFITQERKLASDSEDANYHRERAQSLVFWETYRKFLNLDRLEEVLDRDEL